MIRFLSLSSMQHDRRPQQHQKLRGTERLRGDRRKSAHCPRGKLQMRQSLRGTDKQHHIPEAPGGDGLRHLLARERATFLGNAFPESGSDSGQNTLPKLCSSRFRNESFRGEYVTRTGRSRGAPRPSPPARCHPPPPPATFSPVSVGAHSTAPYPASQDHFPREIDNFRTISPVS